VAELLTIRDTFGVEIEGYEGSLPDASIGPSFSPFHRLLDGLGRHLYTADPVEVTNACNLSGFHDEGVIGYISTSQVTNTVPMYRLRDSGNQGWFYTLNPVERDAAAAGSWVSEGIAGYVIPLANSGPITEQFYAKDEQAVWTVGFDWNGDGGFGVSGTIADDWHKRLYRVGPPNYFLTAYAITETALNNNAKWVDVVKNGDHYITLGVDDRAPFGAGNWVGVVVVYNIAP
jgi:hypothetical protein